MLAVTMTVTCVACGNKTSSSKADTFSTKATENLSETETEEEIKTQDIKSEELTAFSDKGIITGVKNITVEQGTDVKLNELVYADKTIVKSVNIDDGKADYNKSGTYDVIYTITFNGDKLRDCIKDNKMKVNFDTEGDTVIVKTTVKITVATKEETEAVISKGDTSVVTEETVKKENKAKANDNAVANKPSETAKNNNNSSKNNNSNSNSGNHNGNSGNNGNNGSTDKSKPHTHNWDGGTVTTQPTCTTAGTKTYHCSCGETKIESIPALGHDPVTKTDKGHYVHTVIQAAWDEDVWESRYICNGCGATFTHDYDAIEHIAESGVNGPCHNYYAKSVKVNTIHHPEQATDEWVVGPYTVCSRCGQQL